MSGKRILTVICPQLKDRFLIEICCENLGWQLKHFETVTEALPFLSEHPIERLFLDFASLTDFHYDIPRIESCTKANAKVVLCFKNSNGLMIPANPNIKIVSDNFSLAVFLKEMIGEKRILQQVDSEILDLEKLIVGNSAVIKETRRFCEKCQENLTPVLICGSNGSGKKFLAKIINQLDASKKEFVELSLLDLKNLFSWEHVNYLQALEAIKDKTLSKNNICLYLKDFQVLDSNNQIKFLEKFEKNLSKEFQSRQIRLIFSCTNISPNSQLYDFFYKNMKSGVLVVPDLASRKRDILPMFEYFLKQFSEGNSVLQVHADVQSLLENYGWPNNVRELKLVAAQAAINCAGGIVRTVDLPEYLQVKSFFISHSNVLEESPRPLEAFEAYYIVEILKSVNGNISKAARQLGVTRNTIKSKLKKVDGVFSENVSPIKMLV